MIMTKGLPRLGGGVSKDDLESTKDNWSSPPRRGCFWHKPKKPGKLTGLPRLGGGVSEGIERF